MGRERHREARHRRTHRGVHRSSPRAHGRRRAQRRRRRRRALPGAAKVIEATYVFPYLAHAPMEPNDCVIHRTGDGGVEMMFGSQMQTVDQAVAAAVLGLKPEQVAIKTLLAGGSFGRRATPGRRHGGGSGRGAEGAQARGADQGHVDARGRHQGRALPADLRAQAARRRRRGRQDRGLGAGRSSASRSSRARRSSGHGEERRRPDDGRRRQHAALSDPQPAGLGAHRPKSACRRCGGARSARRTRRISTETFLDELADAAGIDPLEIRRKLLAKHPRHLGVLDLAAEKAGWGDAAAGGPRPRPRRARSRSRPIVAQVVEVSMGEDGLPKVEKVVVRRRLRHRRSTRTSSGRRWRAASATGFRPRCSAPIDLDDGRRGAVELPRLPRAAHQRDAEGRGAHRASTEKPTGVGEPGVPPIAPAVANAWAKLTGQRVHRAAVRQRRQGVRSACVPRDTARCCAGDRRPSASPSRRGRPRRRPRLLRSGGVLRHPDRQGALAGAVRRGRQGASRMRAA